jgi:SAM-dependent methyltransferase
MATVTITSMSDPTRPVAPTTDDEEQLTTTNANAVDTLLANFLYPQELKHNVFVPRFQQRITIVKAWDILSLSTAPNATNGSPYNHTPLHILDIGCGQGESAATLAALLQTHMNGANLHITGIDTARPDYGTPYTVTETQAHLVASPLGKHISFRRQDTASFFSSPGNNTTDVVTLCHSLWYFPTPKSVTELFATLATARVTRVYVAEYSFQGSLPGGVQDAHILAARAQALLHAYLNEQTEVEPGPRAYNVRAAPDVDTVVAAARVAGFAVRRQGTFVPAAEMIEGHLEARLVVKEPFSDAVRAAGLAPEKEQEVLDYVPRVKAAFERLAEAGVEKGRAMDVWWAELELNETR